MERRLDDLVIAQERFEDLQQLGGIPFRCPFDPSEYPAFPIDQEAGRQTPNFEGPFDNTLWIEIDLDRFEPELVDKRLDGLAAAVVLRYRDDRDLVAEARLHPLERWHLTHTRLAPGGPEIDEDDFAREFGEADRVPGEIDKRDRRRRQQWCGRGELAEPGAFRYIGVVLRDRAAACQNEQKQPGKGAAPSHILVLPL